MGRKKSSRKRNKEPLMSRRDFLMLTGVGSAGIGLSMVDNFQDIYSKVRSIIPTKDDFRRRFFPSFSYSEEYSPTPQLGQSVFAYDGAAEKKERIAEQFNRWADRQFGEACDPINPRQVMVSRHGDIFVRADCNERTILDGSELTDTTARETYCDLDVVRDFEGEAVYEPFSEEAKNLFRQAAYCVDVPEEWADLDSLHQILRRESNGLVGIPNYTIRLTSTGEPAKHTPESWSRIHRILKRGYDALERELFVEKDFIRTNSTRRSYSSASGLGQLLLRNVDKYYPLGKEGIGNPLAEAAGMLAYIDNRYGHPDVAWRMYSTLHEGY